MMDKYAWDSLAANVEYIDVAAMSPSGPAHSFAA